MKNNYYENVDRYFQTAAVSDDSTPHLLGGTGDLKTPNQYWGDDFGKFSWNFFPLINYETFKNILKVKLTFKERPIKILYDI